MIYTRVILSGCFSAMLATSVSAAALDGSQPFLCALSDVRMCAPGDPCEPRTVESIDAPYFLSVSVPAKKVTGTRPSGTDVSADIELVRHAGGTMFLQGAQETFDWNLAIGEKDGKMTLTLADGENGAIVFGACTAR